jgi:hypothetical protein
MNQEERDELRARHQPVRIGFYGDGKRCSTCVQPDPGVPNAWMWTFYPCDIIKVLDSWEFDSVKDYDEPDDVYKRVREALERAFE